MKSSVVKQDPARALAFAEAELAAEHAAIDDLEGQRAAALLTDACDLAEVKLLEGRLNERRQTASLLADRIAALEVRARQCRAEQLRQERQAAINKVIAPALADMDDLGQKTEQALLQFIELYGRFFERRNAIIATWPAGVQRPPFAGLHFAALGRLFDRPYPTPEHVTQALGYFAKDIANGVAVETARYLSAVRNVALDIEDEAQHDRAHSRRVRHHQPAAARIDSGSGGTGTGCGCCGRHDDTG
jgi:hypothetical protein